MYYIKLSIDFCLLNLQMALTPASVIDPISKYYHSRRHMWVWEGEQKIQSVTLGY